MMLGSIPILAIALILPAPPIQWTSGFIYAVLFNVFLSGCLAWVLWLYALQRLQAGVVSMASMLAPVIGVIAAWVQLNEVPNLYELIGMVLIALSLITISIINIRKHTQIDPAQGQE
jgi:drug/metabolite transporter (DMT)-like permease